VRRHRQICSTLAFAAAAGLFAADEPARPPAEQGIEVAKREYDAIKAAGTPEAQQKLALPVTPSIELKTDDLRLAPPPGANDWLKQQRERAKKRTATGAPSSNWLLDAMAQNKQPRTAAAAEPTVPPEPGELPPGAPADFLTQAETLQRETSEAQRGAERKRELRRTQQEAGNPLDSFMAGWMTPGDFALLVPTGDSTDTKAASPGAFMDGGAGAPGAPALRIPESGPGISRGGDGARPPNPYLTDLPDLTLAAPGSAGATLNLLPPPPPPKTLLPAPATTPEPEPPPRTTPAEEFRKSQNEQKYFRQLKRF
jgi:hypothetical protein